MHRKQPRQHTNGRLKRLLPEIESGFLGVDTRQFGHMTTRYRGLAKQATQLATLRLWMARRTVLAE